MEVGHMKSSGFCTNLSIKWRMELRLWRITKQVMGISRLERKWNMWGYIDPRDLAQACRKALEADLPGSRPYIIAADDTVMDRSSRGLLEEVFPETPITKELGEFETLLSNTRAKQEFGFQPKWSWKDMVEY